MKADEILSKRLKELMQMRETAIGRVAEAQHSHQRIEGAITELQYILAQIRAAESTGDEE